jgi:hypothetical protein
MRTAAEGGLYPMSIYDRRDQPAYGDFRVNPHYCRNPQLVLKWWTQSHDELLARQIKKEQWVWHLGIVDEIFAITPPETIEAWQAEDPLWSKHGYNRLMHFAASRARKLGLTKSIRKPKWRICPLCNQKFVEDSLPYPLVKRLGIDQLDFCAPCLRDTVLQSSGNDSLSKEKVLSYLRDLATVLQRIPNQNFGEGIEDLQGLDFQERLTVLQILRKKPTVRRVKELFGSWLKALVEARVLEDGTRRTSRGIQCLARDGHVCLSLGEKTIDDFLYSHAIAHEKEPRYPEGNFRADFVVDGIFIEYFGLTGNSEYDAKTQLKQRLCKKHGIKLISIYPNDLVSPKKLRRKLIGELAQNN